MHIAQETEVVIGNATNKQNFKIAASAKAFKILSSNIYKNKIRAVVRELVCNAVDAHVLNDNKAPYTIKAPSTIDPRFIVRDYGPGLSDSDMIALYTTYFASSKTERNDQIGALGLGSKSPFSYTPTFSVTSYFEGKVRAYQCMLSNGEPSIVKTFEGDYIDGDVSGIEVVVPAKVADIALWHREIAYIMRPFKTGTYEVTGAVLEVQSFDKLPQYSEDWFIGGGSSNKFFAVYGNIVYPLNDVEGIEAKWLRNVEKNIYFHFPLGQLDIQPSREELSLDPKTVANVVAKVNAASIEKQTNDLAGFEDIENPRELKRALKRLPHSSLNALSNSKYLIQGKTTDQWFAGTPGLNDEFFELMKSASYFGSSTVGTLLSKTPRYKSPRVLVSNFSIDKLFSYTNNRVYMLEVDDKVNPRKTINGMWISDDKDLPKQKDIVIVVHKGDTRHEELRERIEEIMKGDEVIYLKSSELEHVRDLLPKPVKGTSNTTREYRPKSPNAIKFVRHQCGGYSQEDLYLTASEVDSLSGYVVGMYRDSICPKLFNYGQVTSWAIADIKKMGLLADVDEFTVVRPSTWDRLRNLPDNTDCLITVFFDLYRKLVHKVKPHQYFYQPSHSTFFNNLRKYPELAELKKEFADDLTDDSIKLGQLFELVDMPVNISVHDAIYNRAEDLALYKEYMKIAESKHSQRYKDFMTKHYALWYILDNRSYHDDDTLERMAKQFAFLKANGY